LFFASVYFTRASRRQILGALAWFGMRQGQIWAFWTIVLSNIAALAGWLVVIFPVVQKRISQGFDLPPVVLIMAGFILPIAGILGWIGLY
jgi:hypothetical protein